MGRDPLRIVAVAALLTAALAASRAPAAAQVAPNPGSQAATEPERLLFPAWSRQVATLGLGPRLELGDSVSLFASMKGSCRIGWTLGFTAGAVADELWPDALPDLLDLPPRELFHAAPELTSLSRLGAAVGQSLACPSPLVRTGWEAAVPAPPAPPR